MNIQLQWNFLSDWQTAGGQEAGAYADQLCIKDTHKLPYLPGKSIKGLLRHAFATAHANQWFHDAPEPLVALLFGGESREGRMAQGILQFSNACLSAQEQAYFVANPGHSQHLFRVLHSTAIDSETGVAKPNSLRAIEVAIPMVLVSEVTINQSHPLLAEIPNWQNTIPGYIEAVLPLIDAAGAKKQRGLGRVDVTIQSGGKA